MQQAIKLRELLDRPGLLKVPGCFDAVSARLIERAGCAVAYMTGFGSAASLLGLPDAGLMDFSEMSGQAARLAGAINIPLIADGDTGYGNAMNTYRTVRTYARAGVAGIQLEDQAWPKKCGHTQGKALIPLPEMLGKLRAAADAAAEADILIIARTDARAVEGFEAALERCLAFEEAGADVIFFEAPENEAEMARIGQALSRPLLANLVEGGKTPWLPGTRLEALGYKIAIYPVTLLLTAIQAMKQQLAQFSANDDYDPFASQISFQELQELVGFSEYYANEARYKT